MAPLPLALAGGWAEAATCAYALPESFPLLRGHLLPALGHTTAEIGAIETAVSKSAEEDPAQRQNSNGLPKVIWRQPKSGGSSQFHSCSTTSPPMAINGSIASGARKIHFLLIFSSSCFRKFVVNALQSLPQMQHRIAFAGEQRIHAHAGSGGHLNPAPPEAWLTPTLQLMNFRNESNMTGMLATPGGPKSART